MFGRRGFAVSLAVLVVGISLAVIGIGLTVKSLTAKEATSDLGRFRGRDRVDFTCHNSPAWVTIPQMSVTFSLTDPGVVAVLFSGQFGGSSSEGRGVIRLRIDGVVQSGPGSEGQSVAIHSSTDTEGQGFNFISDPQTAGTHTAEIQWRRVVGSGPNICVDERSIIILYN